VSETQSLTPLKRWLISLRAYSFSASLVPALLAAALSVRAAATGTGAAGAAAAAAWWTFPLFALSAVLFHAGTNVLNDYYDYLHGVDTEGDPDPTHAITQGVVSPRFMRLTGHLYFVLGIAVGLPIGLIRGWTFVAAGLLGAAGAYFYTNARFSFKYVALGDLLVFLLMGPALVVMGEWALVGRLSGAAALAAMPVALLVTAILHGNNLRNLESDRVAGIATLAGLLGTGASRVLFAALTLLPFALLGLLAATRTVPLLALAALLVLPSAVTLSLRVVRVADPASLVTLPVACARVHMLFGVLYIAGILASEVIGV
jgi:1,4-dihydroxy-2-naphthoate octaprenyltransferase